MTKIVCTAQPVDYRSGEPTGPPHGKRFKLTGLHVETRTDPIAAARAAGWRVGPEREDGSRPAACPECAAPDSVTVKHCHALERIAGRR